MTHQCPTCGHEVDEVPVEALCDGKMSAGQRKIVEALALVYPRSLTMPQLVDSVYANDIDGGPDNAAGVLHILICRLRKKLPQLGWIIPKNKSGAGNFGRYRLEKIEPVSAPYKFASED